MPQSNLILLNFQEIRRRSIELWSALPASHYHWKPDEEAFTALEMIRHVLEADFGWNMIITQQDMTNYCTPWKNKPFVSVQDELNFAKPYREKFLETVRNFSEKEIAETEIIHPGNGLTKNLAQYLLRIGYHESVHAGNFLMYLRAMGIDRPNIWD